jgi:hypothetical protein
MMPIAPPGVSIHNNMCEAELQRSMVAIAALDWFYNQVRLGGPWDYK